MIVGSIYHPSSQNNFLELLISNMKKTSSVDAEIFILRDFNMNLFLNDFYILEKKNLEQQVNSKLC